MQQYFSRLAGTGRIASEPPLGRLGKPDDVAGIVAFLCSPAAEFITGQAIVVERGATISGHGLEV